MGARALLYSEMGFPEHQRKRHLAGHSLPPPLLPPSGPAITRRSHAVHSTFCMIARAATAPGARFQGPQPVSLVPPSPWPHVRSSEFAAERFCTLNTIDTYIYIYILRVDPLDIALLKHLCMQALAAPGWPAERIIIARGALLCAWGWPTSQVAHGSLTPRAPHGGAPAVGVSLRVTGPADGPGCEMRCPSSAIQGA